MAAGLGFKTFTTGEVLTAADVNGYLMQGVLVFASAAARNAAIISPQEGQFAFTKDTNGLWYYDGAAWVASGATGDIEGVTAGTGLTGGGTSGTVTLAFDVANYGGGSYAAGKNKVINGNFDVWQRGTSSAAVANGTYLADRWRAILVGTSLNATYSRDTSVPNGASLYSAKLQQLTSSATSVTEFGLHQIFEVGTATNFAGKTVTASFWYRSNKTGSHYVRVYTVNATGGTDVTTAFTVNAANTWEYKTINFSSYAAVTAFTGALTDNGGAIQIGINLYPTASMTVSANDYFQISQVQLEAGSTATAFQTATGTLQGELAACQRYYWRNSPGIAYGYFATGSPSNSTTTSYVPIQNPVPMRTTPSSVDYSSNLALHNGSTTFSISAIALNTNGTNASMSVITCTSSGLTANASYVILSNNNTSTYVGFSAEL